MDDVKSVASVRNIVVYDPNRLFERLPYVPHGPELATSGLKFADQNSPVQISPQDLDLINLARKAKCADLVEYVLNPTVGAIKALSGEITSGDCSTLIRLFAVPEVYRLFNEQRYFDLAVPLVTASMSAQVLVPAQDRLRNIQRIFSRLGIRVLQFELFLLLFMSSQADVPFISELWKMVPLSTHNLLWRVMFNPNDINTKTRTSMFASHVCEQLVSLGTRHHHTWLKLSAFAYVTMQIGPKSPVSSQRAKEWLINRFQSTPHSTAPVYLNVDSLIAKRAASDALKLDALRRAAGDDIVAVQAIDRMPIDEQLVDSAMGVVRSDIPEVTPDVVRTQKVKEVSRHRKYRMRNRAQVEEDQTRFE